MAIERRKKKLKPNKSHDCIATCACELCSCVHLKRAQTKTTQKALRKSSFCKCTLNTSLLFQHAAHMLLLNNRTFAFAVQLVNNANNDRRSLQLEIDLELINLYCISPEYDTAVVQFTF